MHGMMQQVRLLKSLRVGGGGTKEFSFSPSPLGTNLVLELIGTWLGLGLGVFGTKFKFNINLLHETSVFACTNQNISVICIFLVYLSVTKHIKISSIESPCEGNASYSLTDCVREFTNRVRSIQEKHFVLLQS